MTAEILVLRLVHILGGLFWVGSGLFTTVFLVPALAGSDAARGQVMAGLQRRRAFTVLPTVAVLTILSGVRLMQITSSGFSSSYFASAPGRTFAASGAAAILAFVLGLLVVRPAAVRAARLGGALASTSDPGARDELSSKLERLQRRSAVGGTIALVLLVLAAAGMAIARYVG